MNTKTIVTILAFVVITGLIIFAIRNKEAQDNGPEVITSAEQAEVSNRVLSFGQQLKMVSLLSPTAQEDIDRVFGPYVSGALIAEWKTNVAASPARMVSSPWPDRIEVISAAEDANGTYLVMGSVVEVTSDGIAASYPVTMTLQKINGVWMITGFVKGSYAPAPITFTGEYLCLPHKDTTGPQTMECAFGLKTDTGTYYSLDFSRASFSVDAFKTGDRLSVTGTVTPVEALSSDHWQKYPIVGILSVMSAEKVGITDTASSKTLTTSLNKKVSWGEVSVTPTEVVSDSRCPSGVQCIWAGEIKVKVTMETTVGHGAQEFTLEKPVTFGKYLITLKEVSPYPKEGERIANSAYRFTFEIKKF